ncbi:DUF3703 domain-containing protein [Streptomyces sp. NPDC026672]|uniref:DUF3703 domain-containing protein n=1 Tax=unclassified Streptomyces TaxID=2593676 RepID=UPI0033C39608
MKEVPLPPDAFGREFGREMEAGWSLAAEGRWDDAYRHFSRAHDLGHAARSRHLAAHRAALRAAVAAGRFGRICYQGFFLGFAWLTSPPETSRRRIS